jgi:hypothetical protein
MQNQNLQRIAGQQSDSRSHNTCFILCPKLQQQYGAFQQVLSWKHFINLLKEAVSEQTVDLVHCDVDLDIKHL